MLVRVALAVRDRLAVVEPERRVLDFGRLAEVRADEDLADADLAVLALTVRDDAGRDAASGRATDIVFAAVVSALAAVVMALVALFMACIAVDIVLADVLARVAAWVILVAAELTLVAAVETVRAAVSVVGLELAVARLMVLRAVPLAGLRAVVVRRAPVPVRRAVLLRVVPAVVLCVDPAAVPRVVDVPPVARAVALVLGRPAERLEALVIDRVRVERVGLRRAVARVVVCTGTDFPPS
jgi:hypothetical protein